MTVSVLVLSALGIGVADFAAYTALKSYLIGRLDDQLNSVAGGSFLRLDRAGIEPDGDDGDGDERGGPLRKVPSAISVTLLDPSGNIIGRLGGELNTERVERVVAGITPEVVAEKKASPSPSSKIKRTSAFLLACSHLALVAQWLRSL